MKFASPEIEARWPVTHPEVRGALESLDGFCWQKKLPELVITCLGRTPEKNDAVGGKAFSWHLVDAAADVRDREWTPEQKVLVVAFLEKLCPRPMWELVTENHGTGPHCHIGRRDFRWRKAHEARP